MPDSSVNAQSPKVNSRRQGMWLPNWHAVGARAECRKSSGDTLPGFHKIMGWIRPSGTPSSSVNAQFPEVNSRRWNMQIRMDMPHGLWERGRNAGKCRRGGLGSRRDILPGCGGSGGTPDSRGNTLPGFIKSWAGSPVRNTGQRRRHAALGRTLPPKVNTQTVHAEPPGYAAWAVGMRTERRKSSGDMRPGFQKIMGGLACP